MHLPTLKLLNYQLNKLITSKKKIRYLNTAQAVDGANKLNFIMDNSRLVLVQTLSATNNNVSHNSHLREYHSTNAHHNKSNKDNLNSNLNAHLNSLRNLVLNVHHKSSIKHQYAHHSINTSHLYALPNFRLLVTSNVHLNSNNTYLNSVHLKILVVFRRQVQLVSDQTLSVHLLQTNSVIPALEIILEVLSIKIASITNLNAILVAISSLIYLNQAINVSHNSIAKAKNSIITFNPNHFSITIDTTIVITTITIVLILFRADLAALIQHLLKKKNLAQLQLKLSLLELRPQLIQPRT